MTDPVPSDATGRLRRRRRNPAPFILAAVVTGLLVYYVLLGLSGVLNTSTEVSIDGAERPRSADHVTLQFKVQDVDLTNRTLQATVLPVAHGRLVGSKPGEMSRSLRIEVASGGVTTSVVSYPGESIVDPTAVSLVLDRGDTAYPFDRPYADFQLSVQDDGSGRAVPFEVTIENSARPWYLEGVQERSVASGGRTLYPVTLTGHRDALSVMLVCFYVLAILLTTLMAVVTIGTAIIKKMLEFSNVIWLSATLLSFPALRSAMPGAPPIGTALDFIVFFPCMCLVAGILVWTGAHLLWRESALLRRFDPYPGDESRTSESPADFTREMVG